MSKNLSITNNQIFYKNNKVGFMESEVKAILYCDNFNVHVFNALNKLNKYEIFFKCKMDCKN